MASGAFLFLSFLLTKVAGHLNGIKRACIACIHQEIGDFLVFFLSSIT